MIITLRERCLRLIRIFCSNAQRFRYFDPPTSVAIILLLCAAAYAQDDAASRAAALKIIPTPKLLSLQGGMIPIVAEGKSAIVVFTPDNPRKKEALAVQWAEKEVSNISGVKPIVITGQGGLDADDKQSKTQLVLASYDRKTETSQEVMGLLDEADRELLADPSRRDQAYVIRCRKNLIAVVGGSAQGTLYGVMTVLQMFQGNEGNVVMPSVHVRDWPDFKYRIAENWTYAEGREHRDRGWCYDWGDGEANYIKRAAAVFDRCLRYKINMICYSSDFFGKASWDGDAFPLEKELNLLADQRGIKLMVGGLGIGCEGTGMLNRKSYPEGEKYLCMTTNVLGNCRGNDALTKQIQERISDYVRKMESRALYIHHEDSDTYASAEWLWAHRCEDCRRRWPSDAMADEKGAAGAFTHGYNAICDAVFSVKNPESGYDASRDCLIILISPTYTAYHESDDVWNKQLAYWNTVSKLLKHKKNVCLGFREQFLRGDNNKRRILEMSEAIRPQGDGPGLFLFVVSHASLYEMGPLFAPVPAAMGKLNEGTDAAYYMCGRIFQEPQILLNAAHMWNTDSLGAIEVPKTASQCDSLYRACARGNARPAGIYGPNGFLELACRRLYGTNAGKHMEKVHEMKDSVLAYARELYIWQRRAGFYWDWKPELERTNEAIAHVQAALKEADCKQENRPILQRFLKCLTAGKLFAEIRLDFQELVLLAAAPATTSEDVERKAAIVERRMKTMEAFLKDNFAYDWATPLGGDIAIWNDHLADMRRILSESVKVWTDEIRAYEAANNEESNGGVSPLSNGDMESSDAWKFNGVTGEEEAGYKDGGYVEDKASRGKRSYRIIKRELKQVSHKWPMPVRTSWGEIEQEIEVQPGQKYAVAFDVFANWGNTGGSYTLEYSALVNDKPMWALDAACPKGWRRGGFCFVAETPRARLKLRTTDIRSTAGWGEGEGDSWWDNVRVFKISD